MVLLDGMVTITAPFHLHYTFSRLLSEMMPLAEAQGLLPCFEGLL